MITSPAIVDPDYAALRRSATPRLGTHRETPSAARWPVGLLGVPFDNVTKAEAVSRIGAMIASRRTHYVVTANVDFLVQARRDVELQRILLDADLVLCDGTPLLWAARWLRNPLPERAAGADVVPLLLAAAEEKGHRIFLLGGGPDVAATAAARIRQQHPDVVLAGHYSPPYSDLLEMDFAKIARQVRAAQPDILLVSFGCPKQEKWIAMHRHLLGVPVLIGVGATLDFLAGRMRRAPALMQRTGTEWAYRLAQEPRRLVRRYAGDFVRFVPPIVRQCWQLRAGPPQNAAGGSLAAEQVPAWQQVRITGNFTADLLGREQEGFAAALGLDGDCQVDLSQVRFLDSTGVAVLLQWRQRQHARGKRFVLLAPSAAVRRTLRLMRLTAHFWIVRAAEEAAQPGLGPLGPPVVAPYPGGHTLGWQGEVTSVNARAVWSLTLRHLTAGGPPPRGTFIIDLSRLRFIDSAGAELMGRLRAWAHRLDKKLRFLGSRPEVRNVLRLAKLGNLAEAVRR